MLRALPMRNGFTLLELIVVIAVIAGLLAMAFPAVGALRARQARQKTEASLQTLVGAMALYGRQLVALPDGRMAPLWDMDQDGLLDGDPIRDSGFAPALRTAAAGIGYHGTARHLEMNHPGATDAEGHPIDGWSRPLHIARAAGIYGSLGIGLWSDGPDGVSGTADDITSWSDSHVR